MIVMCVHANNLNWYLKRINTKPNRDAVVMLGEGRALVKASFQREYKHYEANGVEGESGEGMNAIVRKEVDVLEIHVVLKACHTSHVTRHTSHVARHTSHVTRRTSHVTRHTSHTLMRELNQFPKMKKFATAKKYQFKK